MPFISTIARLKNWAQKTPSAVAMVYGPNRYTYQMVLLLVHRLVKLWNLQGIQKGQLVALNIKDTALELMAALALESIGAIRISQLDDSQLMDRVDFNLRSRSPPLQKQNHFSESKISKKFLSRQTG